MTTCPAKYLLKRCGCIANPIAPEAKVCAYIDQQSGLVTPCDTGCCKPACPITPGVQNILQFNTEFRPSGGVTLPRGYGLEIETSTDPTPIKGAAQFVPIKDQTQTVWERMQIPLLMLVIVLLAVLSIT
jgi:hypothetical protein